MWENLSTKLNCPEDKGRWSWDTYGGLPKHESRGAVSTLQSLDPDSRLDSGSNRAPHEVQAMGSHELCIDKKGGRLEPVFEPWAYIAV